MFLALQPPLFEFSGPNHIMKSCATSTFFSTYLSSFPRRLPILLLILHDFIFSFFHWTVQNALLIYTDFLNLSSRISKQMFISSLASVQLIHSSFSAFIHTSRVKSDSANANEKGDKQLKLSLSPSWRKSSQLFSFNNSLTYL